MDFRLILLLLVFICACSEVSYKKIKVKDGNIEREVGKYKITFEIKS